VLCNVGVIIMWRVHDIYFLDEAWWLLFFCRAVLGPAAAAAAAVFRL